MDIITHNVSWIGYVCMVHLIAAQSVRELEEVLEQDAQWRWESMAERIAEAECTCSLLEITQCFQIKLEKVIVPPPKRKKETNKKQNS